MLSRVFAAAALAGMAVAAPSGQSQEPAATFRSTIDLVSVAVVVRDADGRLVPGLRAQDFEVLDGATPRQIVQFHRGQEADARLALLVDGSGSMVIGPKRERTLLAADFLLAGFADADQASVFSFDSRLRRLTPFTRDSRELHEAVANVTPFGATCIYDAIVGTIRSLADESPRARALLLLTDGIDTASVYSVADAASAAAALDLPVYVLAVGDPDERSALEASATDGARASLSLAELASRTGGLSVSVSTPAALSVATRTILAELHHQYVLAFAAGEEKGWHRLTVRVRRGRVQARSREGYLVQSPIARP